MVRFWIFVWKIGCIDPHGNGIDRDRREAMDISVDPEIAGVGEQVFAASGLNERNGWRDLDRGKKHLGGLVW